MDTALVIMAAGLGSRFGGVKQIAGMGPNDEILMEYSIYDAIKAGFNKVVFIIKDEIYDDVRELCGDRVAKMKAADGTPIKVEYVFQRMSSMTEGYSIPKDRTKPLGTTHAVLCAKDVVKEPFIVINADDYYGVGAYKTIHDALCANDSKTNAYMVGYQLKNTVSKYGSVTRGVCSVENGKLSKVTETYKIKLFDDGTIRDTETDENGVILDPECIVSMNMWGFQPEIFEDMEKYFCDFLLSLSPDDMKSESVLPVFVDHMIKNGKLEVNMLESADKWFGITYQEDRPIVKEALLKLHEAGEYPKNLREI